MRSVAFHAAFEDFTAWSKEDPRISSASPGSSWKQRGIPFPAQENPNPFANDLKGFWSRRITDEHRLVYAVTHD